VKWRLSRNWQACAAPIALAAIVRLWLLSAWSESPFRWYHTLAGLDMQTHVREMGDFLHGHRYFSLYYLLNGPGFLLGGPEGMVVTQAILGTLTAGLVALAALRAYGNRTAAMLAGLLAGLYAPAAMYEMFHLKESIYLFAAVMGLTLLLEARHRHFSPGWSLAAGAATTLPALIRFPGVLWMAAGLAWAFIGIRQREVYHPEATDPPRRTGATLLRRCAWPLVGAASVLTLVTLFNLTLGHRQLPFGSGSGVAFYLRSEVNPKTPPPTTSPDAAVSVQIPKAIPLQKTLPGKMLDLVRAVELSNNLNYYFIRENLAPLSWLIGPLLLLPLALVGLALLLWERRFGGSTVLLLFYLFSFALPLLIYVPLARYRLVLLPLLALWAVYPWVALVPRLRAGTGTKPLLIAVLLFAALLVGLAPRGSLPLRSDDYLAYARILPRFPDRANERFAALFLAHQLDPASASAMLDLAQCQMEHGGFADARNLLAPAANQPAADLRIRLAYATALLGCGDVAAAGMILDALPPCDLPDYFYQMGECRRIQGRYAEAAKAFQDGLDSARNDHQREVFRRALTRIPAAPPSP
jgi:tetratricopeptide (TPR) repeat protein